MKALFFLLLGSVLFIAGCSENQSAASNNSSDQQNNESVNNHPLNSDANAWDPAKAEKMTVAELLERAASAKPKEPHLATEINISLGGSKRIKALRQLWIKHEDNSRYLLAPLKTHTVCPGICVMAVIDQQNPGPNNYGLVAFSDSSAPKRYGWAAKDLDLSNAELAWSSSTPWVALDNPDGTRGETYWILWDNKQKKYIGYRSDNKGNPLPPLGSQAEH
jgi:hypothetical protein